MFKVKAEETKVSTKQQERTAKRDLYIVFVAFSVHCSDTLWRMIDETGAGVKWFPAHRESDLLFNGSSWFTICRRIVSSLFTYKMIFLLLVTFFHPCALTDVTVRPRPSRKAVTQVTSDQVATRAGVDADTWLTFIVVWKKKKQRTFYKFTFW